MERRINKGAQFLETIDGSIIATFPPGFFQKGLEHIKNHPGEQFTLQVTEKRIYLRRAKAAVNGVRPKCRINGQIIAWTPSTISANIATYCE